MATILFLISTALKLALLGLGASRHILRTYRWFFILVGYSLIESLIRAVFFYRGHQHFSDRAYFLDHWATEVVEVLVLTTAVAMVVRRTLKAYDQFRPARKLFWITVSIPVIYSVVRAGLEPPATASPVIAMIIGVEITVQYLVIAITLLYFLLVFMLDLSAKSYESGLILGFGANAGISACGYLIRSILGAKVAALSGWLPGFAYIVAEGVWVGTFVMRPQPTEMPPEIDITPPEVLPHLNEQFNWCMQLIQRCFGKR
jgi:hypothetical protein